MLAWLPIVGPIVQGLLNTVAGIYYKYKDTDVEKYKTDATVVQTQISASTHTLEVFRDDLGVKLSRDLIMFPGSVWCGLYLWDKIVAHHYPDLVFDVAPLDGPLAILPHTLLIFFFGMAAMQIWSGKASWLSKLS